MRVGRLLIPSVVAMLVVGAAPAMASVSAATTAHGDFDAVSCASNTFCVGVGHTPGNRQPAYLGVIGMRDGTGWHGVPDPPDNAEYTSYAGVDCVSASFCMAVGWINRELPQGSVDYSAARVWNGTGWSVVDPPGDFQHLLAVSCTSAQHCEAVGFGYTTSTHSALAFGWDGTSWTEQPVPIENSPETVLDGVSCADADHCTAVGHVSPHYYGPSTPLVESWSPTGWTIGPRPGVPTGVTTSQLTGVACSSPASCTATGQLGDSYTSEPLAAHLAHGTWTYPPLPADAADGPWAGVSCTTGSWCVAVGHTRDDPDAPTTATWAGARWSLTPSALHATGDLHGVSCTTKTFCIAVGSTQHNGKEVPAAERWNGIRWIADLP